MAQFVQAAAADPGVLRHGHDGLLPRRLHQRDRPLYVTSHLRSLCMPLAPAAVCRWPLSGAYVDSYPWRARSRSSLAVCAPLQTSPSWACSSRPTWPSPFGSAAWPTSRPTPRARRSSPVPGTLSSPALPSFFAVRWCHHSFSRSRCLSGLLSRPPLFVVLVTCVL